MLPRRLVALLSLFRRRAAHYHPANGKGLSLFTMR